MPFRIYLTLLFISFLTINHSATAQVIIGASAGYDDHFFHVGISQYVERSKKMFTQLASSNYTDNLDNKQKGLRSNFAIGHIGCLGFDGVLFFTKDNDDLLFNFRPKIGLGILKYGLVSYGYNMYTNGSRSWTWSVEINIPIYKVPVKNKN